jgi:nucleoside-diphosphate-sugar epimerase
MISILGCGWYGLALGKELVKRGHLVNGSTTSANRINELKEAGLMPYTVNITGSKVEYDTQFFNCETLIICIPPKLRSGSVDYIAKILELISLLIKFNIKQVVYISSTGVYPESNATLDETVRPKPDTDSGKILFDAEELLRNHNSFKCTVIRFGGLVGPGRHPGRFFSGKTDIPNGRAPVNLIHLTDCLNIALAVIDKQLFGQTYNACAPHHPSKFEFYTRAAQHAGFPLPQFIDELQQWKAIESVNLTRFLNYHFTVNDWFNCFAENRF